MSGLVVLPNPGLQPERSWSFEIGGTQLLSEHILLDAAVFQNEFWDLIQPSFLPDGRATFQNVTRARIQGVELGIKTAWFNRVVSADLGYTYIVPKDITNEAVDKTLKYRPRHLLYASAGFTFNWIHAAVDFRYLSRIEEIDEEFVTLGIVKDGGERKETVVTDARVVLDLTELHLPFTLTANVNNLFQYHYVDIIGNLAPIRNCMVTVEGRF